MMNDNKIVVPTKEEVKKLIRIAMDDSIIHIQTIGELLGMKLVDSLLPIIKGEPEWGFDGLKVFFNEQGINGTDTFEEALKKLK